MGPAKSQTQANFRLRFKISGAGWAEYPRARGIRVPRGYAYHQEPLHLPLSTDRRFSLLAIQHTAIFCSLPDFPDSCWRTQRRLRDYQRRSGTSTDCAVRRRRCHYPCAGYLAGAFPGWLSRAAPAYGETNELDTGDVGDVAPL